MSTPSTFAPSLAAGNAVVPSPHPRSRTSSPLVIPSSFTSASPLSRMLSAMRVKSPFSHSALFGFIGVLPFRGLERNGSAHRSPCGAYEYTPRRDQERDRKRAENAGVPLRGPG